MKLSTLWGVGIPLRFKQQGKNECSRPKCKKPRRSCGNYCDDCHAAYMRRYRAKPRVAAK